MADVIARYTAEAVKHGHCMESGDFRKGNAAFDRMMVALAELRRHPDRGESVLIESLNHPSGWVKLEAATHLLPLREELAISILEALASGPRSMIEFNAKMVLQEWRNGSLKVP